MSFTKKIILQSFAFLFVMIISQKANSQYYGVPLTQKYSAKAYKGATQNWAFTENREGVLYVGNGDGLLQFDGKNWSIFKLPNLSAVRCFDKDKNGTIYLGAQSEIGYLTTEKNGTLSYNSLLSKIPKKFREFQDIWQIALINDRLIFQTSKAIYINKIGFLDSFAVVNSPTTFHRSFKVLNQFFVREQGAGIKKLVGDSLVLIPGSEIFKTSQFFSMLPISNGNILVVSRTDGLWLFNQKAKNPKDAFKKLETPEIDQINKEQKVFTAIELPNNQFAFATLLGGIYVTDSHYKILYQMTIENGLSDNLILSFYIDKFKNLWVGTGNEITYVLINSPFTNILPSSGFTGVPYNSVIYRNKLYISGSDGVFYQNKNKNFVKIPEINGQTWGFFQDKNNLYCSSYSGFYKIEDTTAKSNYYEENVWDIKPIPNSDELILGTYYKSFLKAKPTKNGFNISKIKGYSESVRYYIFDDDCNLWFSTENGICKARLNKTNDSLENIELFDTLKGIPENSTNFISLITVENGKHIITAATPKGVHTYNPNTNFFDKNLIFNKFIQYNRTDIFTQDSLNTIWFQYQTKDLDYRHGYIIRDKKGEYQSKEDIFQKFNDIYTENISNTGKYAIFNTSDALYLYDKSYTLNPLDSFNVVIRKIAIRDSVIFSGNELTNVNYAEFPYTSNDLVFTAAALFFENSEKTEYSYYLEGSDEKWTEWSVQNSKEYTNIREGKYIFKVKARNVFGIESPENSFSFTVKPPWFRTIWAYLFYLIALIFVIWGIVLINIRRLKAEKAHLEKIVRERTAEILIQKEEIQTQAENLLVTNQELLQKNSEINQQKEEISAIADNLKSANEVILEINTELTDANDDIQKKSKNITDSINYAKNIQRAMLPTENRISEMVQEYFIFYIPRDIVSGDFYFFKQTGGQLIIAAADCTGHGVPGGFMSMLGISVMNQIVSQNLLQTSGNILDELRNQIKISLRQTESDSSSRDGMDISLMIIDIETLQMQFSGANLPLYIFREKQFIEILPDKMPIGIYRQENPFSSNDFQLQKGDMIYLFSDGYIDQFGHEKDEKFKKFRFIELLTQIHEQPVGVQRQKLFDTFQAWRGNVQQIDDILVLGIKI